MEIKLGIVGTNFVSDWFCNSVNSVSGIVNYAVYSRTNEKGDEFAKKHGIATVYNDFNKFLASDIEAVYIASPNFLHFEQAKAALKHGKHVIIEKPATLNAKEFDVLCDMARERKLICCEAMRPGHDEMMLEAKKAIKKIGTVRRAVLEFCQYSTRYDSFKNGIVLNAFNPALGNGAIMDIGVYAFHCCVMLFGKPKAITAKSLILHNGMEGMGTAILDYGDMQAEVAYSKISDSCTPSVILGENGYVKIGKLSTVESVAYAQRGEIETIVCDSREENNMIYEISDFVKAINGELDITPFNENTEATLLLMDEARKQNNIIFPTETK